MNVDFERMRVQDEAKGIECMEGDFECLKCNRGSNIYSFDILNASNASQLEKLSVCA